jgi:hypothetical protein
MLSHFLTGPTLSYGAVPPNFCVISVGLQCLGNLRIRSFIQLFRMVSYTKQ